MTHDHSVTFTLICNSISIILLGVSVIKLSKRG